MAEQPKKISRPLAAQSGTGSQRKPAAASSPPVKPSASSVSSGRVVPVKISQKMPAAPAPTPAPVSQRLVTGRSTVFANPQPTFQPARIPTPPPPVPQPQVFEEEVFEEDSLLDEEAQPAPQHIQEASRPGKSARSTVFIPPHPKSNAESKAALSPPTRNTGSTVIKMRAAPTKASDPVPAASGTRLSGIAKTASSHPVSARRNAVPVQPEENTKISSEYEAGNVAEYTAGPASERASRRNSKRTNPSSRSPGISKKKMIVGGSIAAVVLVGILVVVIGYKPYMRSSYIATLSASEGSSETRKKAVDALVHDFTSEAYAIFREHLVSETAGVREASAYGMERLVSSHPTDARPVTGVLEALGSAPHKEAKLLYIKTLVAIGDSLRKAKSDSKSTSSGKPDAKSDEVDSLKKVSTAFIVSSSPKETETEVRLAAIEGLGDYRLDGICSHLIKLAKDEKGPVRECALSKIQRTARPDAIGDILHAMQSDDKEFAGVAKKAFLEIRDSAKTEDLVKMILDPSVDVRREIIDALSKRSDAKAAEAMIGAALGDKEIALQIKATKALTTTGIHGSSTKLKPLMTHADEGLRVAVAETLGSLQDPDSYKMVLEAFTLNFDGATLTAYTQSLGKRSQGRDLKACDILIKLLDSTPAAQKTIYSALLLVTNNGVGKQRDAIRGAWDVAKWKSWYAHLTQREQIYTKAKENLEALRLQADGDKKGFIKLKNLVIVEMDQLEKCLNMCKPDDLEDEAFFKEAQMKYSVLQMHFAKNAHLE